MDDFDMANLGGMFRNSIRQFYPFAMFLKRSHLVRWGQACLNGFDFHVFPRFPGWGI